MYVDEDEYDKLGDFFFLFYLKYTFNCFLVGDESTLKYILNDLISGWI